MAAPQALVYTVLKLQLSVTQPTERPCMKDNIEESKDICF